MKPKLLIVIPHIGTSGGGVSEAARLLAHSLFLTQKFEIHVLSIDTQLDRDAINTWPSVKFHFYSSFGPKKFGFSLGMIIHMLIHKYDIIHVHGIWTFHVAASGLGLLKNTPIIISPHGMLEPWILKRSKNLKLIVSNLYQNQVLKSSAFIHVLTKKEEQDVRSILPDVKVIKIPNFVKDVDYDSVSFPKWYHESYRNKKIFLFFGRIHDKKGWRNLLEGWSKLCQIEHSFKHNSLLIFCGWNDGVSDFESLIDNASAKFGNIFFVGPQYGLEKLKSYSIADYFILPSQSEGLPVAVLEAVKHDNLVMMSRACNLSEMIDIDAAVDTGESVESIINSLILVYKLSDNEIKEIKLKAVEYVNNNFSESYVTNQFVQLFFTSLNNYDD
ncbi:glycosyltransferase [Acinetobacter soli]|uniref:glycosyltransferase n=1 Tax=Acinetobacter soli TaxID=487316 RepID=UPI000E6AA503|nr:glycosyltransferase [Acinetobacter soli]